MMHLVIVIAILPQAGVNTCLVIGGGGMGGGPPTSQLEQACLDDAAVRTRSDDPDNTGGQDDSPDCVCVWAEGGGGLLRSPGL